MPEPSTVGVLFILSGVVFVTRRQRNGR
ncbi:PEP-CTERM sorting domain-containing protein [Roseiconus nitratireducens]|uniref:PEP-CTERM sorting domain-containing protein n=1 Tax=Roseiconus nitratireducens TaxID=2605748 RepID=A0A5M6CY14_9BACT|nr:PEP-CTERM sorting domain-containing protein [Roseiconus nitratireducens]